MSVYLEREFAKMRFEHLANLMDQITHDVRPTLERALRQCESLDAAAETLREQIEELHELDHVERLSGGPVVMTEPKGRKRAA